MQPLKARSFFVRVLPERPPASTGAPIRRGYVVELPDGAERWFEHLEQLPSLIAAFLDRAPGEDDPRHGEGGGTP